MGRPLIAASILAAACVVGAGAQAARRIWPLSVVTVPPGGSLQVAIDRAVPGDVIVLQAGATYTGPFELPRKTGDGWITIESSAVGHGLPPAGMRVSAALAAQMPRLISSSGSVLNAASGAGHYRLIGLEVAPAPGVFLLNLIQLGATETSTAQVPHDFDIERCYVHGDPRVGSRRGVALNSATTSIVDSYFSDFKEQDADSQAIAGWNGPGPFSIVNNYLEGAGENVMFGGADPSIPDLVPADITFERNYVAKPLRWKAGQPTYEGVAWSIKNLFELKNAQRVKVDGNIFEYNWPQSQNGYAILFTVRNQDGHAPWSIVDQVSFTNNIVRHVGSGMNILGQDDIYPSQQANNLSIVNNVFDDVGGAWGDGRLFQVLNGASAVTFDHNTAFQTDAILLGGDAAANPGFIFRNNIAAHNQYGIIGSGVGVGNPAIARYFPSATVVRNVIAGGSAASYPADNFFPASLDQVGFVDRAHGNYRLSSSSPYKGRATDGHDVGADIDAIDAAIGGGRAIPRGSTHLAAAWIFWTAIGLLAYAYVGYEALIWLRAAFWPKPLYREPRSPHATIIVVAHNEAARIEARIENLLALDYPRDRMDVVIASDGSTDDTVTRARAFEPAISVVAFPTRRGKPSVLDELVPRSRGEIVVLADARQRFDRGALAALAADFADPAVGAVSGELLLVRTAGGGGSSLYWSYEKLIRWCESEADSTIGATGAIYAIRRDLFEAIPPDTILDDVTIPMRIVKRGYRVVFEPRARAYDRAVESPRQEFVRKVRTMAGNFQWFGRERWVLHPGKNRVWLQTISHKGLRLALPALYAAVLVSSLVLMQDRFYAAALAAQAAFYGAAIVAELWPAARARLRVLVVPHTLCLLTCATVVGAVRYLRGRQQVTWDRASAPESVPSV